MNHPITPPLPNNKPHELENSSNNDALSLKQANKSFHRDKNELDLKFDVAIDGTDYFVWVFQSPTSGALFASFTNKATDLVVTKRLAKTWIKHANESVDKWRSNIASVLLKSRGPEETPKRAPARAPPGEPTTKFCEDGEEAWSFADTSSSVDATSVLDISTSSVTSLSLKRARGTSDASNSNNNTLLVETLKRNLSDTENALADARRDLERCVQRLEHAESTSKSEMEHLKRQHAEELEKIKATPGRQVDYDVEQSIKRARQQGHDDAMAEALKTLELMQRDVREANAARIKAERDAEAKIREAECITAECESVTKAKIAEAGAMAQAARQESQEKIRLALVRTTKLEEELKNALSQVSEKDTLVKQLTKYVTQLDEKR